MKKHGLLLILAAMTAATMAQEMSGQPAAGNEIDSTYIVQQQTPKKNSFFKVSNITYGGNFGFHLSSHDFSILLMPEVGYKLFPQWKFTAAPMYSYYGYWGDYYSNDNEHVVGVRIGTQIDLNGYNNAPKANIFVYLGYQYEHHWVNYTLSPYQYDANFADIGVGLRVNMSQRARLYILAAWHAYANHNCDRDTRYTRNWFPDLVPSISVGIEIH